MLLEIGTRSGALQGSGGTSWGGCRSAVRSGSSVLLGWFGDKFWSWGWDSETVEATAGPTDGPFSETLAESETNRRCTNRLNE